MRKTIYSQRQQQVRTMLVEKRNDAGLTQAELAKRLDRKQSYVSNYERGERRLDLVEFLEIANALNFDPARFIRKLMNAPAGT